jgi:hypothetical protein
MFIQVLSTVFILFDIGGLFFRKRKKKEELEEKEAYNNRLLCRFVLDGSGRKIGESVAIYNDILIIKSGIKYLGVPIKHIEEEGKILLVKGLIDQNNAEIMGEIWRRESFEKIDNPKGEKDGI